MAFKIIHFGALAQTGCIYRSRRLLDGRS